MSAGGFGGLVERRRPLVLLLLGLLLLLQASRSGAPRRLLPRRGGEGRGGGAPPALGAPRLARHLLAVGAAGFASPAGCLDDGQRHSSLAGCFGRGDA